MDGFQLHCQYGDEDYAQHDNQPSLACSDTGSDECWSKVYASIKESVLVPSDCVMGDAIEIYSSPVFGG